MLLRYAIRGRKTTHVSGIGARGNAPNVLTHVCDPMYVFSSACQAPARSCPLCFQRLRNGLGPQPRDIPEYGDNMERYDQDKILYLSSEFWENLGFQKQMKGMDGK